MRSEPPTLVDVSTGSEFRRYDLGDATMTIETTVHPYRQLAGAAFVSLATDIRVAVNDERWEPVIGLALVLPGGCEVDVDNAELERALEDIEECDEDFEDVVERRPDLVAVEGAANDPRLSLGFLVPLIVNDADLPPVRILARLTDLRRRFQRVDPGDGAHARGSSGDADRETKCRHVGADFGRTACRGCLRRFWMMKARALGVIDG